MRCRWRSDAPLRGRAAHTATLLGDGRVLIVGGCATDGCTTAEGTPDSEYYVPGRGFTVGPDLGHPRDGHTATLLADGRVLIVGGWTREGTRPLDSVEVYLPRAGRFEPVEPMGVGRGGHTATALRDGRVLLAGGQGPGPAWRARLRRLPTSTNRTSPSSISATTSAGARFQPSLP